MSSTNLVKSLAWRYAVKKFDPTKKVSETDLHDLLEALRLTPSSFGLEPWKFIVVKDASLRERLKAAAWNQSQVTDASHLIVLCAKKDITKKDISDFAQRIAKTRGVSVDSVQGYMSMIEGYRNSVNEHFVLEWNKKQVYIALGFLMATAASKDIDSCPMEGFSAVECDKILGLDKQGYTVAVLCPVGYRAHDDAHASMKKVRHHQKDVVEFR